MQILIRNFSFCFHQSNPLFSLCNFDYSLFVLMIFAYFFLIESNISVSLFYRSFIINYQGKSRNFFLFLCRERYEDNCFWFSSSNKGGEFSCLYDTLMLCFPLRYVLWILFFLPHHNVLWILNNAFMLSSFLEHFKICV